MENTKLDNMESNTEEEEGPFSFGALLSTKEDRLALGKGRKAPLHIIFNMLLDNLMIPICVISNRKNETFKQIKAKDVVKNLEVITFYIRYNKCYEA